jgi:AcrR family transcriptional regulator
VAARSDGAQARERLLYAALRRFAASGFERTSVRDIAQAAGANVSAVGYYFGDKEGLYRTLFTDPSICGAPEDLVAFADPGRPLAAALRMFYVEFLAPLKRGDEVRMVMKLHLELFLHSLGLLKTKPINLALTIASLM